jgi:hypothetical protein
MILHGYVKQCKKCDFFMRRGDFVIFFMISSQNGPLQKNFKIYTTNSYDFARKY